MTGDDDRGILGRIAPPAPDRSAPAASVDVLLVDGDAGFREHLARILRRSAHSVVEAGSAAEASAAVRGGCAPRLLVVDLAGVTRPERAALGGLLREPGCAGLPVVVLSRDGEATPGIDAAARLLRPVDAAELVAVVRRLCGTLDR